MYEDKNISKEEYEQAKATDVSDGLLPLTNKASYEPYLDNYIKQVIEQVSTEANADIYSAGLDVYTNLDPDIQNTFGMSTTQMIILLILMTNFK